MKKLSLLKTMLLLCALIAGSSYLWADTDYEIVFKSAKSDSSSDLGENPAVSNVVSSGTDYVASFSSCSKMYVGVNGIKLGSSSAAGTMNFTLASSYQANVKKIKVVSAKYGSDTGTLTLYSGSTSLKTGINPGTDYTHTFATPTTVSSIKLVTSAKRAYITKIILTIAADDDTPDITLSTSSLDFGSVNVGESKDLTFTVTPANLTGALTISCDNDKYSVTPTSIAQSVTTETTITVTANPTAYDDDMDGTITISGGGISNKTVALTTIPYDPSRVVTYELVTSSSPSLKPGDKLLIVYTSGSKAMGAINTSGTNNIYDGVDVTISTGRISIVNEAVAVLTLGGEEDAWTFKSSLDDKYLSYSSGNSLTNSSTATNNAQKWEITIDNTGVATIENVGTSGRVIKWNSSSPRFACYTSGQQSVSIYRRLCNEVTIGASGYASYCSASALNFTDSDVKAYKAKVNGGKVVLTQVDEVPANEGVILYGEEGDYNVTVVASASAVTENELVGVTTETTVVWNPSTDVYNYILQQGTFKKATDGKLRANHAYLSTNYNVTTVGAHQLEMVFDDENNETTGIKAIGNSQLTNDNYFNLAGQRVAQPTKGLYIVNGKKVVIK